MFFANGGDIKAEGVDNGLRHPNYSAMDLCHRRVFDADIQNGKLKLDYDDEDVTFTFAQQKTFVEQMLVTVARDSLTDAVKEMMTLNHRVFNCRHFKTEVFASFAERFRGVAQDHLNCFRHVPTEAERNRQTLSCWTMQNCQTQYATNF